MHPYEPRSGAGFPCLHRPGPFADLQTSDAVGKGQLGRGVGGKGGGVRVG